MRKGIFTTLLLALTATTLLAIPARRVPVTVRQADGTSLTLQLNGDEFFHYYTDNKGTPVRLDDKGMYTPFTFWQMQSAIARRDLKTPSHGTRTSGTSTHPRGESDVLVLLVQFTDVQFTIDKPKDAWTRHLNEANYTAAGGYGSARDYFISQSNGLFTPDFNVFGPYTVSHDLSYYGGADDDDNDCRPGEMVSEALKLANSDVDFKNYDQDGDGVVDFVHIIFAGYSEASGGSRESIWPHNWYLSSATGSSLRLDGVRIDQYSCSSELHGNSGRKIDGIGAIVHEFSHSLGLPDFYDVGEGGHLGMSYWSVMASGCYVEGGYTPIAYTAYEKEYMGWLDIETLDTERDVTLAPLAQGGKAYRVVSNESTDEYYLLENVQQEGWNRGLYGHGLRVLHVDYDRTAWTTQAVNTTDRQRMTIVPADGSLAETSKDLAGDPYPGNTGNSELSDTSEPAAITHDGNPFSQPITDIREADDGTVTFSFMKNCGEATTATAATAITSSAFTAHWGLRPGAEEYSLEVFHIQGEIPAKKSDWNHTLLSTQGELILSQRTADQQFTIQNLEPNHLYCYRVRCLTDGVLSPASNLIFVTTAADDGTLTAPQFYEAVIPNDSAMTLRWNPVSGADRYLLEYASLGAQSPNPVGDGRQLLKEDFSTLTSSYGDVTRVLDIYTQVPDWTGLHVTALEGAVSLGCADERGVLTTPAFPVNSDYVTVCFSVAKHNAKDKRPILHICLASDTDDSYYVDQVGAYITSDEEVNYFTVLGPLSTGSFVSFITNSENDSSDEPIIDLSHLEIYWGDLSDQFASLPAHYAPLCDSNEGPAYISRSGQTFTERPAAPAKIPTSDKKYIEVSDTTYTFGCLDAGSYCFRVRAVQGDVRSPFSESLTCETGNTTFLVDGLNYDIVSDELHTVRVCPLRNRQPYTGDIVIPPSILRGGIAYTVTELSDSLFRGCTELQSVAVPATVSYAGTTLFKGCDHLAWVDWQGTAPLDSASFAGVGANALVYVRDSVAVESTTVIVVRDGEAGRVALYINAPFLAPKPFHVSHITYSKDFSQKNIVGTASGWETLVLPFDVQTVTTRQGEQLTPFGTSGTERHYWLGTFNGEGFDYATTLQANIPYVIAIPNSDGYEESQRLGGILTFSASDVTVAATTDVPSVQGRTFQFVPIYKKVYKSPHRYMLNCYDYGLDDAPAGSVFTPDRMSLRTFGACLEPVQGASATPQRLPIHFGTSDEEVSPALPSSPVYSLDGRQVRSAAEAVLSGQTQGLPAGIYLINRQKVIVR